MDKFIVNTAGLGGILYECLYHMPTVCLPTCTLDYNKIMPTCSFRIGTPCARRPQDGFMVDAWWTHAVATLNESDGLTSCESDTDSCKMYPSDYAPPDT